MNSPTPQQTAFDFLTANALQAGVGSENLSMTLTVDLVNGEPQAHRLCVDLEKSGARLTRNGEKLTVYVDYESARRFSQLVTIGDFAINSEAR
jgi:hypothetical protein